MSPASSNGSRPSIVLSTTAAGTINQIARGAASFLTKSSRDAAPVARSLARSATALADMSNTTQSWPPRISRLTMFAPIRPNPIIPSCIGHPFIAFVVNVGARPTAKASRNRWSLLRLRGAIAANQRVRRTVVRQRAFRTGEFPDDLRREHLAEFYAPLIERIDVPDHALYEHAVFVQRHQPTQRRGRQCVEQQRVRRPVAFERAMRHQSAGRAFRFDFFGRFAERKRLALRQHVRNQHLVVFTKR